MMKKSKLYFFILIGLLSKFGLAQESQAQRYSYKIVDANTQVVLPYTHVYNESKRYGSISDSAGQFFIHGSVGDTLVLMALGYFGASYQIDSMDTLVCKKLFLKPRSYQIEEVSVTMPQSYQSFKQAFLKVNTERGVVMPELPRYNHYITPQLLDTNIIHSVGFMVFHPVSGLYYRFSKEEKSKRKVWYLQTQELHQKSVDDKFNRQLVSQMTGLLDWELTEFLGFCNFSFNYLHEATQLEIILAIENKFAEYQKCCYDKENNSTHTE